MTSALPVLPLPSEALTTWGDLPVHPLVVHVPVVVLPLTAILLILAAMIPAMRRRYLGLGVIGALIGLLGVIMALVSGNAFAQVVGLPPEHESAANRLLASSIALFVLSVAWWILRRVSSRRAAASASTAGQGGSSRAAAASAPGVLPRILGILTALAGVAVLIFAVQTGHSGAQAAWSGAAATTGDPAGTSSSATESSASAEGTASAGSTSGESTPYSLDEVASHDSAESCWAAIDGTVYDLTDWIGQHPGGEGAIESLCGTDGTEAFTAQHEGNEKVADRLSGFELGELAS